MTNTLNDIMEIDHVVTVHEDGTVTDNHGLYSPELYIELDEDGQITNEAEQDMIDEARSQGWELLAGWTGQYSYRGVLMHASEYVGGSLEKHIRETPGCWVAVIPANDDCDGDDIDSWVLCYRTA